jgi:hypothetical protein
MDSYGRRPSPQVARVPPVGRWGGYVSEDVLQRPRPIHLAQLREQLLCFAVADIGQLPLIALSRVSGQLRSPERGPERGGDASFEM